MRLLIPIFTWTVTLILLGVPFAFITFYLGWKWYVGLAVSILGGGSAAQVFNNWFYSTFHVFYAKKMIGHKNAAALLCRLRNRYDDSNAREREAKKKLDDFLNKHHPDLFMKVLDNGAEYAKMVSDRVKPAEEIKAAAKIPEQTGRISGQVEKYVHPEGWIPVCLICKKDLGIWTMDRKCVFCETVFHRECLENLKDPHICPECENTHWTVGDARDAGPFNKPAPR